MSSSTPAPRAPSVTTSAVSFTAGRAFATATPHSAPVSMAWSFSASPTATVSWRVSPSSASAASSPLRLCTLGGSTITAPLLKVICSSRPSSPMAASTAPS